MSTMNVFHNPSWLDEFQFPYKAFDEVPSDVFAEINRGLDRIQDERPEVSIVVPVWNEELTILNCVASLSRQQTNLPVEIIVVDNNSTDNTAQTLEQLHVKRVFQPIQGWGPARQKGLEAARGHFVLSGDADSLYPPRWVDTMYKALQQPGVSCVCGRYAFRAQHGLPRWKLFMLEKMRHLVEELKQVKRSYLNAFGCNMGFPRHLGLKVGYVMRHIRGEDGRMAFGLMQMGRIRQVKTAHAVAWTSPRSILKEGSFGNAMRRKVGKELKRVPGLFVSHPPHDPKTSTND